jgi:probable rRNA maturation factor
MITVQRRVSAKGIPAAGKLKRWALYALQHAPQHAHQPASPPAKIESDVLICIVDQAESHALNLQYRGKDKPTNVLSFPEDVSSLPANLPAEMLAEIQQALGLGTLVVCAEVMAEEARAQGKSLDAHWAHIVTHGVLHLLGFDHETEAEAEVMESLEATLLMAHGFSHPYGI